MTDDTPVTAVPPSSLPKKSLRPPMDARLLVVFLLLVIAVMLFLWKPWQAQIKASDRTISVTGSTTLTATPDEYIFNPSYDFTNSDRQTAIDRLSSQSDQIVGKLKALGVASSDIQTNSSGYSGGVYLPIAQGDSYTYTLGLTITVDSIALAQKVQDYLVTTSPSGAVSPSADFSDAKQKNLENQARGQATTDARAKAEQSAKNLGFKIAGVKSVTDDSGFGSPVPYCAGELCSGTAQPLSTGSSNAATLGVQPGQNKFSYSVSVVYYIR